MEGGGGEGSAPHSEQPLQPPQVHLSSQSCVLSSQNDLHTGAGTMPSVQPVQPPQMHLSSQSCVLSSQNGLHYTPAQGRSTRSSVFIDGEGRLSSCGSAPGFSPGVLDHGEGVTRLNTPTRLLRWEASAP